tara:strand:+ start:300 stop:536 length:237 start_codon:yes stop_codon:yes gene_type:complete
MKETMYLVKDIEFDITDGGNSEDEWTYEEYESLKHDAIGLWYAEDGDHLCDKITDKLGFCILSIDYTTNTLHPLTSYM